MKPSTGEAVWSLSSLFDCVPGLSRCLGSSAKPLLHQRTQSKGLFCVLSSRRAVDTRVNAHEIGAREVRQPARGTSCATGPNSHRGIGASRGRVVTSNARPNESVPLGALGGCFDGLLASDAIVGWTDADQAEGADVPEVRLLATQAILQSIFWARRSHQITLADLCLSTESWVSQCSWHKST